MIPVPGGVRVWLASVVTDMRRGMNTPALQVQEDLRRDPTAVKEVLRRYATPRLQVSQRLAAERT